MIVITPACVMRRLAWRRRTASLLVSGLTATLVVAGVAAGAAPASAASLGTTAECSRIAQVGYVEVPLRSTRLSGYDRVSLQRWNGSEWQEVSYTVRYAGNGMWYSDPRHWYPLVFNTARLSTRTVGYYRLAESWALGSYRGSGVVPWYATAAISTDASFWDLFTDDGPVMSRYCTFR